MITTKIDVKPHLKEYLIGRFNDYTPGAVRLPSDTDIYHLIADLTAKRPIEHPVDRGNLEICLPDKRGGKDPQVYNYLSEAAQRVIERRIEVMFWAEVHDLLDEQKHVHGQPYIESANWFLSKYAIEAISADALIKNYYRWREKLRRRKFRRSYTKK